MNTMKRSRLRPTAKRKQKDRGLYAKKARAFIEANPECQACAEVHDIFREARPSSQIHHRAGRNGKLLLDERYWLPVCAPCHRWITDNGRAARTLGLTVDLKKL